MKNKNNAYVRKLFAASAIMSFGLLAAIPSAFAQSVILTRQLDLTMTGSDVSALQIFLAKDPTLYPQGLVTGYFGPLTSGAVARFQTRNGLDAVGRVGPLTLVKLNAQMNYGMSDVNAPIISNATLSPSRNTATFSWNTGEASVGKVYYSKTPFSVNEGTGSGSNGFYVSGNVVSESSYLNNHNIVLQNLDPNTRYYYTIVSTDLMGNYNMTMVTNTFTTTN